MKIFVLILKKIYILPLSYFRAKLISIIGKIECGQAFSKTIRELMWDYHGIEIGIGTYGSCFDLDQTWVGKGNLKIGKYTSIAKGVCIYTRNHPYDRPSTSPLFYNATFSKNVIDKDTLEYQKLHIGNDVWIGQYAVILPSCHYIGNGAVVGAGCIVTKDVPDYAIVVGNPGKIIKFRFEPETIKKIEESKWWENSIEQLSKNQNLFQDTEIFLNNIKN